MWCFKLNGNHIEQLMKFHHLCIKLVIGHSLQLCSAIQIESNIFLDTRGLDNFIQANKHFIPACSIKTHAKQNFRLTEDGINCREHFKTDCIQPV